MGAFGALLRAQESDTAVFKDDRGSFTILSDISDAQERQAFLAAYSATDPAQRHSAARAFVERYPQSWLLAQAYDLAARGSIDLGDHKSAREEGRFSLRLIPENPMLLVLMANVEAQDGLLVEAQADGHDALEYLDQFARPGNLTADQWRELKPQLKASAYFALGRALLVKTARESSRDRSNLMQPLDELQHAAAWNPNDAEILYVRGLVEMQLGRWQVAGSDFAAVVRSSNSLRDNALSQLRTLYRRDRDGQSFDAFVAELPKPGIDSRLREETTESISAEVLRAGYAGSAACQDCHSHEYATWRQTGMARMLREYKPENVMGDFSPGSEFRDATHSTTIRMGTDSRPYFELKDARGNWERFRVDYTIGSKWQQGYATRLPDGRLQVLPIEYNTLRKAWINYWEMIDPPSSERAVIANFTKLTEATNYQQNCAICHTSQLRASSDHSGSFETAAFREPGVNCEMCHGPSAWHVQRMHKGGMEAKPALESPVDFRRIDNRTGVRICAQCHKQTALRQVGPQGELNYSSTGSTFVPISWTRPYDAFSRRAFYKDGRFRETTFIVEAFMRSACYRNGAAQCASCHAPHVPNFAKNPTSLKFKDDPNEMCLRCHETYRARIAEHTRHSTDSEGSQCVSCHMPRIMNALLFQARSHQIEIPRADLTERFGQSESPNACLICHAQKNAGWARQLLQIWRN